MRHKTNLSRVAPCVQVNNSQATGVCVTGVAVVDDKLVVARSDGSLETITLPAGGSTVDLDALRDAESRVGTNEANIAALQTNKADKDDVVELARDGLQSEWQDAANQAKAQAADDATTKADKAKAEAIAEARALNNATKALIESWEDARGVVTGRLVGSDLELVGEGDEVLATVELASLIPTTKADRFLSAVSYDQANKQLVFTTEAEGEDAQTITVPMADVIPVINAASTTQRGIVELATVTEAKTGTATNLAVTPAGLTAALAETKGALDAANQRIQALEAATAHEEECTPIMLMMNQELRAEVDAQPTLCQLADGSVVMREPKQYVYTVDRQETYAYREDIYVAYDYSGTRVPIDRLYRDKEGVLFVTTGSDGDMPINEYDVRYYVRDDYPIQGGAELTLYAEQGVYATGPYEHQDDTKRLYTRHQVTAHSGSIEIPARVAPK